MAKLYEDEQIPAHTRKKEVGIKCDMCREEYFGGYKEHRYDAIETTVAIKEGQSYPEGGCGDQLNLDICPNCFNGRLIPWLESQGVDCTKSEWEW